MRFLKLLTFAFILFSFSQCGPAEEERNNSVQKIQQYEKELKADDGANGLNEELADQLISESTSFVHYFPKDSLAASILFKAADVARGVGDFELAVELWGQLNANYPNFEKAPDALFLQGFVMDKDLKDAQQAILFYNAFLEKYPQHPFVKDVNLLKEFLEVGKTPEELIREFEQNRAASAGE